MNTQNKVWWQLGLADGIALDLENLNKLSAWDVARMACQHSTRFSCPNRNEPTPLSKAVSITG
jgi:hypothetical protein